VLKDAIQRKFVTEIEINDVIRQVSFTLLEGMANLLFQQHTTHDSTLSSILTTETSSSSSVVTQSLTVSCSSTGAQIQVEIMASPRGEWARAFVRNIEEKVVVEEVIL
jgi:hypothetical protein